MIRSRLLLATPMLAMFALPVSAQYKPKYTIEQFLSPPFPLAIASAKKADRIAWVGYDRGKRNVYTAAAPTFTPLKLTQFNTDDGTDITEVQVSDDGSMVIFVRGTGPNGAGWVANPSHDPDGAERAIWAVRSTGGPAIKLVEAANPQVSPDGKQILYTKDGQIYRARFTGAAPATPMDKGEAPFIKEWGAQSAPRWSPDGQTVAFVSTRNNDHSFIGFYDVKTRVVTFPFPGVDRDASPSWSPDGKRIAFSRRPGVPFGMQAQDGGGNGAFTPAGPAAAAGAPAQNGRGANGGRGGNGGGNRGGGAGRGAAAGNGAAVGQAGAAAPPPGNGGGRAFGGGRAAAGVGGDLTPEMRAQVLTIPTDTSSTTRSWPGMYSTRFKDGTTLNLMTYNLATHEVKAFWKNDPQGGQGGGMQVAPNNFRWMGESIVFQQTVPNDEWDRYYAIKVDDPSAKPFNLITTDGLVEDQTSVAFSGDGKTMYYCTNAKDIEHRHIWAVSTSGGEPKQLTSGDGIETSPVVMGGTGKYMAVLYATAKQPELVAVVPTAGGTAKPIEKLPKEFPIDAHVVPQIIHTTAADGVDISNELFLPADLKPGEKRPAIVFAHGGSQRQMLPGYHYMQFYHEAYAVNQWLASQGYVVLSINYRSGIGYGRSFRNAKNVGQRGNTEYLDILAGAKYLQGSESVDPKRIGMWGLSYGGDLTSQALARNSDIFVAGADLAGVHLWGSSLNPQDVSFQSSTISAIDKWKSPVFLVQGDDDRNVDFTQMIGLVQLLRQRNVYYDLTVIPDDVHESLVHGRWEDVWSRMGEFMYHYVWNLEKAPATPVERTVPR